MRWQKPSFSFTSINLSIQGTSRYGPTFEWLFLVKCRYTSSMPRWSLVHRRSNLLLLSAKGPGDLERWRDGGRTKKPWLFLWLFPWVFSPWGFPCSKFMSKGGENFGPLVSWPIPRFDPSGVTERKLTKKGNLRPMIYLWNMVIFQFVNCSFKMYGGLPEKPQIQWGLASPEVLAMVIPSLVGLVTGRGNSGNARTT